MGMLNVKRPSFWIIIVLAILLILTGIALLTNLLVKNQSELAVLDEFTMTITRRHQDLVDMTAQYKAENPDFITEKIRVLACKNEPDEPILAELADDISVENLVNEWLAKINDPLVDFSRPLHLYVRGYLIVQYAGADEALLKSLAELLGPEWPHDVPYEKMPVSVIISTVSQVPLTNRDITDESELRKIQPIIAACNNGRENWPGKPVDEMTDKTQILVRQTFGNAYTEYTLFFDDTDSAYLIANQTGHYCRLDDARKSTLLELARAGFYENPPMTVRSGDSEIKAIGHWVYSYDKITKLSADSLNLKAQNIKAYLAWLPINFTTGDQEKKQTLTVYMNGQERFGDFILYDDQMNRTDIIKSAGQSPQQYMLNRLEPGRYIVELHIRTETLINETGYQYFFGIIVEY